MIVFVLSHNYIIQPSILQQYAAVQVFKFLMVSRHLYKVTFLEDSRTFSKHENDGHTQYFGDIAIGKW